jgi:hypothetical protein
MRMSKVSRSFLVAGLLATPALVNAGASCLLFPLSCLAPHKKYGEEVDATILSLDTAHNKVVSLVVPSVYDQMGSVHTESNPLENTREFFVAFQIGMTRYVGWWKENTLQMLTSHIPRREEFVGKTVKVRFADENWMGLKTPLVAFKTPKDWKLVVVDIIGPDGIDECNPALGLSVNLGHCKPQAEVDRAKREADAMAALKAKGIDKPLWDVQDAALAKAVHLALAGTQIRQGQLGAVTTLDATAPAAIPAAPAVAAPPPPGPVAAAPATDTTSSAAASETK